MSSSEVVVKEEALASEDSGKFNPNGPGVFGFNQCAVCGTRVDINGLDMDNRKHFEADGGCAGFAQADLKAQAAHNALIHSRSILNDAVDLYQRLALDLRFIAINEPKLIEAKRRVDDYSERLGELRKQYAENLLVIEAPRSEAEGLAPGFYGSDPTCILDFPGWTKKTPSLEEQVRAIKERMGQKNAEVNIF